METLLNKVRTIEREARERLEAAEAEGKATLADLLSAEQSVLDDVRQQAEARAEAIIKETEAAAKAEINALRQDEKQSVATAHSQAAKQRAAAVEMATNLFRELYLSA